MIACRRVQYTLGLTLAFVLTGQFCTKNSMPNAATSPRRAICRAMPATFECAVVQAAPLEPIRLGLAQEQHQAYMQALASLGVQVSLLPADSDFPDCCFVEDCAVYAERVALITRLGVASRRGEEQAVAEALRPYAWLEATVAPATLEGGDCLRLGKRWFVGRSQRTNAAGMRRLCQVFEPLGYAIIEVPLGHILHLKCVCSRLGDETLLLAERTIPPEVFGDVRVVHVPADESYAANCVCVDRTVLLPAGFPSTRRALETAGLTIIELDMSEIRKADGSMSCLSILM